MNLYKVTGKTRKDSNYPEIIYITAVDEPLSIAKFIEVAEYKNTIIVSEFLCKRDDIIPTVEPIKEQI
tara:strand:+ start:1644 stop:1847 length:204 start_codon:yes stop_codon:yes gene_type:complete